MNSTTRHSIAQSPALCQPSLNDEAAELQEIASSRNRAALYRRRYERTGDTLALQQAQREDEFANTLICKYDWLWRQGR